MNIALLAHDGKKELMVQFCIAYCGILAGHDICATNTTLYLPCSQGGSQQIGARIAYNELDLVLFFCDPNRENTRDVDAIARLCDQHSIPFASNVATAEVLVQGLRRGDLDWRNIVNPQKR